MGQLTLVPTPISRKFQATESAKIRLNEAFENNELLLVEDLKPSRQRWRDWDLPREAIERFICFNEQTSSKLENEIVENIKNGQNAVLMSDGGLPVVCDPGLNLVFRLRENKIRVTSTQFDNSMMLALALSGFKSDQFIFSGFPAREKEERKLFWKNQSKLKTTSIIMDTAYRTDRIKEELIQTFNQNNIYCYFGFELNSDDEEHYWGDVNDLKMANLPKKKNFVLCISPK